MQTGPDHQMLFLAPFGKVESNSKDVFGKSALVYSIDNGHTKISNHIFAFALEYFDQVPFFIDQRVQVLGKFQNYKPNLEWLDNKLKLIFELPFSVSEKNVLANLKSLTKGFHSSLKTLGLQNIEQEVGVCGEEEEQQQQQVEIEKIEQEVSKKAKLHPSEETSLLLKKLPQEILFLIASHALTPNMILRGKLFTEQVLGQVERVLQETLFEIEERYDQMVREEMINSYDRIDEIEFRRRYLGFLQPYLSHPVFLVPWKALAQVVKHLWPELPESFVPSRTSSPMRGMVDVV